MIRFLLLKLIRCYQLLLSPFMGPRCRFVPSCSQYAYEAIQLHGPIRGSFLAAGRLLRCHPFHRGGYDPVTEPSKPASSSSIWRIPEWKKGPY